jgi:cytochrome c peroxidase
LHITGHLDEIQDTYDFTRLVMAGQWFVPQREVREYLGRSNAGMDPDLDALAAYIASLVPRTYRKLSTESAELVDKGREIFFSREANCASCHPPPLYTDSGERTAEGAFVLHYVGTCSATEDRRHQQLDTPSLIGLRRSEPYLHDGRAKTLEEVFTKFNSGDKHGKTSHLSKEEIQALAEFLRSNLAWRENRPSIP